MSKQKNLKIEERVAWLRNEVPAKHEGFKIVLPELAKQLQEVHFIPYAASRSMIKDGQSFEVYLNSAKHKDQLIYSEDVKGTKAAVQDARKFVAFAGSKYDTGDGFSSVTSTDWNFGRDENLHFVVRNGFDFGAMLIFKVSLKRAKYVNRK